MTAGFLKKYPVVGACGLDCGLCPRYHTAGPSKCPGCAGPDFEKKHPACGFITCCVRRKRLETCALCPDWPECGRVSRIMEGARKVDSFISYRPLPASYVFIQKYGIEEFTRRQRARMEVLGRLLEDYDDGRSKAFFCVSCHLLPPDGLKKGLAEAGIDRNADIKERAGLARAAINRLADSLGIDLRLRKPGK